PSPSWPPRSAPTAPGSTGCCTRTSPSASSGAATIATSWAPAWWSWPAGCSRASEVAGPLLQALADELTATTALTVRDGEDAAVVLDVRSPRHADMHITYRPGLRHPVAIAASGIAILAGGPARDSERDEVTTARERGWSRSTGELLPGATGVAAPVGDAAAVSAVWIGERDEPAMARVVVATARALADAL